MKKSLTGTAMLGTLLLGLSANPVRAEEVCRMTVPFAFDVNGHTLPSGRYRVRIDDLNPALLMIEGLGNSTSHAMVLTMPDYGPAPSGDGPAVTFVRSGNQYRLSTVWETRAYGRDVAGRARITNEPREGRAAS